VRRGSSRPATKRSRPKFANRFFRDRDGDLAIWQRPNLPLIGWAAATATQRFVWHNAGLELLAQSLLFTWAYLELADGASCFRRLLGAAVIAGLVVSFLS